MNTRNDRYEHAYRPMRDDLQVSFVSLSRLSSLAEGTYVARIAANSQSVSKKIVVGK